MILDHVSNIPESNVNRSIFDRNFDVGAIVYGFGCGRGMSEFKIVRVLYSRARARGLMVDIFRVGRWEWEELKGCDGLPLIDKRQANVNGVVHWLARRDGNNGSGNLIVGFDFEAEVFVEIKVPVDLGSKGLNVLLLASRRGTLSVFVVEERGNLSLWEMEEYGVEGSWSNRFVMSFNGVARRIRSLRKNGKIVLEQNGYLLNCCDPETNEINDSAIEVPGAFHAFHMKPYVGGLVLLDRDDARPALKARKRKGCFF